MNRILGAGRFYMVWTIGSIPRRIVGMLDPDGPIITSSAEDRNLPILIEAYPRTGCNGHDVIAWNIIGQECHVHLEAVRSKPRDNRSTDSPRQLQPRQRPGRVRESVRFDAQALEHAHVQVAQGWWLLGIEGRVLAVFEAAAGEQHGQVAHGVAAGVAEISTAQKDIMKTKPIRHDKTEFAQHPMTIACRIVMGFVPAANHPAAFPLRLSYSPA